MNDLISIVVPVYNAEKYLPECVYSILSQTHKNLQLILVNDGSTDSSLSICNYYKSLDKRVIVVDKENEGVSAARNAGMEVADGDFIGFVDSDDYIERNMYEVLLNHIRKDGSEICTMTSYTINRFEYKENSAAKTIDNNEALKNLFLLKFPTSLWAYLYSRDIIKNYKLNKEIHFFEDFEFNFRILSSANKISLCNQRLYNYRVNDASINTQEINDKKITCLSIYDLIVKKINIGLIKYAMYTRAHFLISVISSIAKSKMVDEKYYRIVQKKSQQMLKEILYSAFVPIKYKIVILMFAINPYYSTKLLYSLKYKSRR